MSFGAGLACGIGAGFASGIGAGVASGRKQARDEVEEKLRNAAQRFEVTVRDRQGQSVPFDELVDQVLPEAGGCLESERGRKVLLSLLVLGTVCLVGIATYFIFAAH